MSDRRVVITGIGAVSPIGNSIAEIFQNLSAGISGIGPITRWDASELTVRFAGEVSIDPSKYFDPRQIQRRDRIAQFAVIASTMAVADSGVVIDEENCDDVGVLIGASMGGVSTLEEQSKILVTRGANRVSPQFATKSNVNIAAAQTSIAHGAKGPCWASSSACASGAHAIGEAFEMIRRDDAKVAICGGTDAGVQLASMAGFCGLNMLSKRNDDPSRASRPFDVDRDGFVLAEGSGIVVLEDMEYAVHRGARIYAELIGYGNSMNGLDESKTDHIQLGAARSMTNALNKARLTPADIQYVNAHGSSARQGDLIEALAMKSVFRGHTSNFKVSSTKSMTGHMQGASGGFELIACILGMQNSIIFPTINLDNQEPECDLDLVPNKAISRSFDIAMSNSFGLEGQNVSLILKKFQN